MNVLSLFSGIGGLELGLERAGMTTVGQVELDPWCRRVLAKHWPDVPRHDDVRTTADWWRSEERPNVDVICGGFPCQPVSVAGRRLGQDDERWLWPAMADTIRVLRPRYALMENVPGLLVRGMGDVLGDLAAIGYDAEWRIVSAADLGAPHLRRRVFIIAYPNGELVRDEPVAERRGGRPTVFGRDGSAQPLANSASRGVADADGESWRRPGAAVAGTGGVSIRGGSAESGRRGCDLADAASERCGQGRPGRPVGGSSDGETVGPETLADTDSPRSQDGRSGRAAVDRDWWAVEPDVGRVATGVPGRVDRLRGLGNAVVPQVAEHIGRLIMAA